MKISVITINFNNANGLERTLRSVISQTFNDYELIIVDGASTDGSVDVIKNYAHENSRLNFVSEKDTGIYNAMNKGINMSQGEYLIFMNSGDCFYDASVLELSLPFLKENFDIICGIALSDKYKMYPPKKQQLSMSFFLKNSLNHQATFIKTKIMKQYYYNEKYKIVSDTEFFFKSIILDNASYLEISIKISYCENAGASGNLQFSLQERYKAIKALLPERMSSDVDFIIKYNNPIIRSIGNALYNKYFRALYDKIIRRGRRI